MSFPDSAQPSLSWRDRIVVAALLVAVSVLAWAYTVHQAAQMNKMEAGMLRDMAMSMNDMPASWTALDVALLFVMWTAMMAAMMVPSASPMIAAFATINRRRRERDDPCVPTAIFLAGYIAAWAAFSLIATGLQYGLQRSGLLTTMMQSSSAALSAVLFIATGFYQFSPLKELCLARCRSPQGFILSEWRDGALGAAIMGLRHGLFCTGCCAALMILLFAVAVMDLRWVVALALIVTIEKLLPGGRFWRVAIGIALIATGMWFAYAATQSA